MNRSGIALAADSAITIGDSRVWKSSNKLFHLTPNSDIGLMIYGSGSHCGLPWEVLIKEYRKCNPDRVFISVQDQVSDFLQYLDTIKINRPLEERLNVYDIFDEMIEVLSSVSLEAKSRTKRRKIVVENAQRLQSDLQEYPLILDNYSIEQFESDFGEYVLDQLSEMADVTLTKAVKTAILDLCHSSVTREFSSSFATGLVFAGFGQDELLPLVHEIMVDGVIDDTIRTWTVRVRDMNGPNLGGMVIPFAQSDIAHLFVEGLLPDYLRYIEEVLSKSFQRLGYRLIEEYVRLPDRQVEFARQDIVANEMLQSFRRSFKKYREAASIQPMMSVVNSLPKEEMAAMAEALVETTSLRRKMDSRLETVGGPVDVAIISKSDGFVWIKRKHYFDAKLNPDFVSRRRQRHYGGKSSGT